MVNPPPPVDNETHDDYMARCTLSGHSEDACMVAHEGHTFMDQDKAHSPADHKASADCGCEAECQELPNCREKSISVATKLTVDHTKMFVNATTGETVILITGTAFHSGANKNNWELGAEAGMSVADQLKGADLTLNHPKANGAGFSRNMDGGVDEATVGIVTKAEFLLTEEKGAGWVVEYEAEVHRKELFEALESGLWLRPEYGVSIGGYGIPTEYNEETGYAMFASEFTLDHLAIVHRPAYPNATIDTATVVNVQKRAEPKESIATLKYGAAQVQANEESNMTDDVIESNDMKNELEALQAELILSRATVEQFQAKEAEVAESQRASLVEEATALGLSGHEALSSDVITNLIASWNASNPPAEVKEMKPVEAASEAIVEASAPAVSGETVFVANYFNGSHLKTAESIYARAFNSWASAYNRGLGISDDKATRYEDLSQTQRDLLNFTEER